MPTPAPPLILTLALDSATFALVDALRQQHFPRARNQLPAHVTLFHQLPGAHEDAITTRLSDVCAAIPQLQLVLRSPRFLGRGVAIDIECDDLLRLHADLSLSEVEGAGPWRGWLTPQDRERFRPHVTIQNKVAPETARALFDQLGSTWHPLAATAPALTLSRYHGGPWQPIASFPFRTDRR